MRFLVTLLLSLLCLNAQTADSDSARTAASSTATAASSDSAMPATSSNMLALPSPAIASPQMLENGSYFVGFSANVTGFKLAENRIFLGFDNGELGVFDPQNNQYNPVVDLPKISSTTQSNLGARITSVDAMGGKIAFIHDSDFATKKISVFDGSGVKSYDAERGVKQVYFLDEGRLLIVSLSSEIYYLDIKSGESKMIAKLTLSNWIAESAFDRDSGVLVVSTEGGVVIYFDTKTQKTTKELPIQKDILYTVAAYKDRFIAGSATNEAYYFDGRRAHIFKAGNSHVYKVALHQNGGAYYTDGGYIAIFDEGGVELKRIDYDKEQIHYMEFWGDFLITAGYDNKLYFWSVK